MNIEGDQIFVAIEGIGYARAGNAEGDGDCLRAAVLAAVVLDDVATLLVAPNGAAAMRRASDETDVLKAADAWEKTAPAGRVRL